jgi:LuxR family maltose regulon positive regulatory protein
MESAQAITAAGLPLLATKLHVPGWRPGFVSRPRLVAELDRRAGSKLTLVAAPPGFGKTTLLAEWLATTRRDDGAVAWVSLDEGDNDPARFWTYVIAALRAPRPSVGEHALAMLQSPHPPPIETVLTLLINDLAALEDDLVLVLDDLHIIESSPIHSAVAFLLDHLPPRLRLVIATRADPPLPLARLRVRGELVEVRAADLRFTGDEALAFFNDMMGLGLGAGDVAALEARTEGWIAGLQLAALSLRGRQDSAGFIRTFAGDHRYVVDYLIEEVLQRQPEPVRRFLLQTAILDRLSGPLCDAVTGEADGAERLAALERGNFFVVPLDDARRWHRYHHLFADVLRARLAAEQPELVPVLHRRASLWHERHGDIGDAIRHALAAHDADRAADLIERAIPAMRQSRQEMTLLGWLKALPEETLRRRPVLDVEFVGTLLSASEIERAEARLNDIEAWLEATGDHGGAVSMETVNIDDGKLRQLPGSIAMYRAGCALVLGDLAKSEAHASRVLELVPDDDHLRRGAAAAMLGLAAWSRGDLETAHRSYVEGMARLRRAGHLADVVGGGNALADIRLAQGRLRDAWSVYESGLRLATEQGEPTLRGAADMHVGLGDILRERNELDAAEHQLRAAQELGEHLGFPQFPHRSRLAMARLRLAQGDLDGALESLDEAERRYVGDFFPNVRPIAAMRASIWTAQGRLDEAFAWARDRGLAVDDEPSFLAEFEHLTLARALIARFRRDRDDRAIRQAIRLLEQLAEAARAGGRMGNAIEILVVLALGRHALGDASRALASLDDALALAEPEGYTRTFIDEGEPMRGLLRHAAANDGTGAYARRLLGTFGEPSLSPSASNPAAATLAEPLTTREIEILRLIAAGLRNQEIADRLFISLPTVKRHIANAYGKLGAGHRTEALARAAALDLL